ncbi:DUF4870 family protein [Roseateles amylovorans]|jgi:uncharacterized membrane protein|uniref:Transmembrane protein n=1 Tax=Roseateles amylovorans TaxID=2978473 RepID=A0ABY6B704_9BURK|nr:hypothetical protein [Roseateles amylovorans]UXH79731.1 hypothetical protein N4261_07435 [Roseateles amylovorans]
MNDDLTVTASPMPAEQLASLKQLTLITYILYALSFFTGFTGIVAVIINYIKREDTAGTIYASHFTWQIRTFWWSLLWFVLGGLLVIVGVGFVILIVDSIWVIYRLVKGILNWNDNKPMPV